METHVYILLGSNLGDREQHLISATRKITGKGCEMLASSSVYQTRAWGKTDQPDFLNQVIRISTVHTARELLNMLLQIEIELGRVRNERWGERIIDLDILFFGDRFITETGLIIPHPGIALRRFTLVPLCEIASQFIHPMLKKTCETLLHECTDTSIVEKHKH